MRDLALKASKNEVDWPLAIPICLKWNSPLLRVAKFSRCPRIRRDDGRIGFILPSAGMDFSIQRMCFFRKRPSHFPCLVSEQKRKPGLLSYKSKTGQGMFH